MLEQNWKVNQDLKDPEKSGIFLPIQTICKSWEVIRPGVEKLLDFIGEEVSKSKSKKFYTNFLLVDLFSILSNC